MRIQTQNKGVELQKKFPAIRAALARLNENNTTIDVSKDRIYISVVRVDDDLLCNLPLLCSGKGASLCDRDLPGLLGWQHDVFFAVDSNHQILAHIGAICPDEKLRDHRPVKHLVLTHRNELSYLVRLTVTGWCHRLSDWKGKDNPLGELSHRDIAVTVYREPDEGFDSLLNQTWTDQNLRLHFCSIFGGGSWAENPDVQYFLNRFFPMLEVFKEKTFFNGFYDSVPCLLSGDYDGKLGDVSFSCSVWKGGREDSKNVRARFTRGDVLLQVFCSEVDFGRKHICFEGLDGTLDEARQLLEAINVGWVRNQIGEDKLQHLENLWAAAAQVVSTDYLVKLKDPSHDQFLFSAVPGLKIFIKDKEIEGLWVVEVPVESDEAFQNLLKQGTILEPSEEEVARLRGPYDAKRQRRNQRQLFPQDSINPAHLIDD